MKFDADYVFVVFGGLVQFTYDDIAKVGWYPRVAAAEFSHIQESDYQILVGENGRKSFALDSKMATPAMRRSLVYKLSYYRNREIDIVGKGFGYDRARGYIVVIFASLRMKKLFLIILRRPSRLITGWLGFIE